VAVLLNPKHDLFVQLLQWDRFVVYWGPPPGDERPGEPSAPLKWTGIAEWVRRHDPRVVQLPDFLKWSEQGLVLAKASDRAAAKAP
jgi:hypothetical protein